MRIPPKPHPGPRVFRKPPHRSRVTNGRLLPGDNRGIWVRRCKDLIELHLSDLGGEANCSAAEKSLIRRVAVLSVELEQLEQKFAIAGEASPNQLDLYGRSAGNLRRILETLGLERRARDITPLSATNTKLIPAGTPLREVLNAEVITHER
jgi:hypothetical protein